MERPLDGMTMILRLLKRALPAVTRGTVDANLRDLLPEGLGGL